MARAFIESQERTCSRSSSTGPCPVVVRGDGVWVEDAAGRRYLDAMSGGSMAATLGHGRQRPRRGRPRPGRDARVRPQRAADEPRPGAAGARAGRGRARRVSPRAVHGQRRRRERDGDPAGPQLPRRARRARALAGDLARAGLPRPDDGDARAHRTAGAAGPFGPVPAPAPPHPAEHVALRPDRRGGARRARPRARGGGPENVSAFFCEAISAAALPAYTPPRRFWEGLAERRERHGFLVCFDEVVTGVGRTGRWFAGAGTACTPDIIATAKGLGAGYAAIGAVLCREHVYEAVARRLAALHARSHLGRRAARRAPSGSRSWRPCVGAPGRARPGSRADACGTSSRARSRTSRSCTRSGGTGTCSGWSTSTRATAIVPAARAPRGGPGRPAPRSSAS